MASLPAQHPRLALHLTDRALTPIISSSSSSSRQPQQHNHPSHKKNPSYPPKRPTFSTSPPPDGSSSSSSSPPSHSSSSSVTPPQAEEALAGLSSTALSAYDAAKRLGKGAPLRTMVEYPEGGLVVLHSYMCPMSLALGTPGRNTLTAPASLHTSTAGALQHHHQHQYQHHGGLASGSPNSITNGDNASTMAVDSRHATRLGQSGAARPRTPTTARPLSAMMDPVMDLDSDSDGEGEESPNAPPMLISTVVAPRAEDLREARRAAGRLERIARVFQTEWVVDGGGGGGAA